MWKTISAPGFIYYEVWQSGAPDGPIIFICRISEQFDYTISYHRGNYTEQDTRGSQAGARAYAADIMARHGA